VVVPYYSSFRANQPVTVALDARASIDEQRTYDNNYADGMVMKVLKGGGTTRPSPQHRAIPMAIAVDATSVTGQTTATAR